MSDVHPQPEGSPPPPRLPYPYPAPPPRPRVGVWIFLALLIGAGLCLGFGFLSLLAGAASSGVGGTLQLHEELVQGEGLDKVALIELEGAIMPQQGGGGLLSLPGLDLVESFSRQLDQAAEDPQVKAVLLYIDSPGGAVHTSDQLWHALKEFKRTSSKPVVVHMGSTCASGGYYLAVAADKILCEPTTITGSIGVLISTLNFHDLLAEHGVRDVTLTSGPNKDLLNPFGPVRESHEQVMRGLVDSMYARFTELVADGRQIPIEQVRKLADGRIYMAQEALDLKLVDQIGYREDALALARSAAGLSSARLVRYRRPPTLAEVLSGGASLRSAPVWPRLDAHLLDTLTTPRVMALWRAQ